MAPTLLELLGLDQPLSFLGMPLMGESEHVTATQYGLVVGHRRCFLPESGTRVAGCFSYPEGAPLPTGSCDAIRAEAGRELEMSNAILARDLARPLAAESSRPDRQAR